MLITNIRHLKLITAVLLWAPIVLMAQQPDSDDGLTEEELAFFNDDSTQKAQNISSGELRWIEAEKTHNQYHLDNTLTLQSSSLTDGWIDFKQCHYQLDPRIAIEIVYGKETTRLLTVESYQHITKVAAQPTSIVMEGVSENAQICVTGQTQSLKILGAGKYRIERGPYMRRFLDGYYPMHLSETLNWPGLALQLQDINNQQAIGYSFENAPNQLKANYWFEGMIRPFYNFSVINQSVL